MGGERRDRRLRLVALADRLAAVAAVLGRQHELLLLAVVVALRPAVPGALLEIEHLLGREVKTLLGGVELRPVLVQLVAAVLRHVQTTGGVEVEALAVADAVA